MSKLRFFLLLFANLSIQPTMAQTIETLQTPQDRFKEVADYPFAPHYVSIAPNLRMHYVDEGNPENPTILLLHGEPSWSFLYRRIIPPLVKQGYRVIAPDLVGFGKSDKPIDPKVHTYQHHTTWLTSFIEQLDLTSVHLYCHDWGGMIALRIVASRPELFASVIVSYAFLFTGEEPVPESFRDWQRFSQTDTAFRAGTVMNLGSYTELSSSTQEAYDAPFPNERYKAGARRFPMLIPTDPTDLEAKINAQLREKLKTFDQPFLTIWGDHEDPMWQGKDKILQAEVPGAQHQEHQVLHASHFLQEDQAEQITKIIIDFLDKL